MRRMECVLVTIILTLAGCGLASGNPAASDRVVRVLTVGNSFSRNASTYLKELAADAGYDLVMGHADIGGCWLGKHWAAVEAAEANPDDPAGKPYSVTVGNEHVMRSLKEMLTDQKWNFVTIQQASLMSVDLSTYEPYARKLRDYIKKYAPQAEVLIHETWAYRCDEPGFGSNGKSEENMYKALSLAYRSVASELGLRMMPVGDAFYAADTDPIWGYKPADVDSEHATYPDLPNQTNSLHVGWYWARNGQGKQVLVQDCHHANANGCYLAGCIWYEVVFNRNVLDNKYVPSDVTPAAAGFLRRVAHRAVQQVEAHNNSCAGDRK